MHFAKRLEELMCTHATTNYRLAKSIGCSNSTVANWLSGKEVKQSYLEQIADYFHVSIDYLLGKEEKPTAQGDGLNDGLNDGQLKVALFGGDGEVTDEMWDEVKNFAQFIKEKKGK